MIGGFFVDDYPVNLGIQYNVTSVDTDEIDDANRELENDVKLTIKTFTKQLLLFIKASLISLPAKSHLQQ